MPMVVTSSPNDTYRTAIRMKEEKEGAPRPITPLGGGRGGSLIAFAQGHGGPQS